MSAATCPTCGKSLDPLRAPSVKVIAGRITAFCSPVCAGRAQTDPVVAPAAAPGAPAAAVAPVAPAAAAAKPAPVVAIAQALTEKVAAPPFAVAPPAGPRRPSSGLREDELLDEPPHPPYDAPYDEPEGDGAADDADDPPAPRRRRGPRRARILLLTAALVAGGAAIAVLSTVVSPSHPKPASAGEHAGTPPPAPPPPAPAKPPAPAHADPAKVYAKGRAALRTLLQSPSDRVRLLAAMALARVPEQDAADRKAAIAYLAGSLDQNASALNRMKAAFALARAGAKDGLDSLLLATSAQQPRRDVRSEAAADLLELGDKRGVPFLADMMGYEGFQLTSADALARIGDAKAIAFLRAIVKDPKAGKDQHLRALYALAWAGQADVADELRKTLADKDAPRPLTAQALGRLGDAAAIDPLVADLDVESLRVDAALALRRLAEHVQPRPDPGVWADKLERALAPGGRDTDQASAAEAALILLGPSILAEHE